MKKIFFCMMMVFMLAIVGNAQTFQTSLVATLTHEGNTTSFYTINAFKDAYKAAVDGDLITLSSGSFATPDRLEKALTIRGAGMMLDNNPTIVLGKLYVDPKEGEINLEGLYINGGLSLEGKSSNVSKCRASYCSAGNSGTHTLIHCFFPNGQLSTIWNGNVIGCYMQRTLLKNCVINNSIINFDDYVLSSSLSNSIINNSILTGYNAKIGSDTSLSYSYVFGNVDNPLINNPDQTSNKYLGAIEFDQIFKNQTTYELNDEYAETLIGSDGTQAGIHGGSFPFDPTTTNPQITKFNVAEKTTADGKLSVDIEVKSTK